MPALPWPVVLASQVMLSFVTVQVLRVRLNYWQMKAHGPRAWSIIFFFFFSIFKACKINCIFLLFIFIFKLKKKNSKILSKSHLVRTKANLSF